MSGAWVGIALAATSANATATTVVQWNALARKLALHGKGEAFRTYALLSIAQLRTARRAADAGLKEPALRAAMDAASAGVLLGLYPAEKTSIEAQIAKSPSAPCAACEQGQLLGARCSREVLTEGAEGPPVDPKPPDTTWAWTSAKGRTPVGIHIPSAHRWVLDAVDEVRPPSPPLPDTPEFAEALTKVKIATRERTAPQQAAADYWAGGKTGEVTPSLWNDFAAELIAQHSFNEREAASALALLNAAMNDAAVACFEAKYHYWLPRPSQADPAIKPTVSLPNFPAYPSAHACFSGAAAGVLDAVFPDQQSQVDGHAAEATDCRVWSGLHYPFDGSAGLALGRQIALKLLGHPDRLLTAPATPAH